MKYFCLSILFLSILSAATGPLFAQARVLREDLSIKPLFRIEGTDTQTRIAYDASDKSFYTIAWNGDLFHMTSNNAGSYNIERLASAQDHGINYMQGLALYDGSVYLAGNVVIAQGVSGYGKAVKAKLTGNKLVWTEVFKTAEHASSKTLFDHAFSAICFSPDGKDMYIASGSRTDHGEVKDNEGRYPGLREVALTACIFKIPANTENLQLPNDSAALAPYVHVRGVRNAFSLAFAANGDLFSVENSGDRDDPEEMNWIRPGAHYGFPWEMGGNDTPMQFAGYKPDDDKLINRNYTAYQIGAFHDDKQYPKKPQNLTFRKPIRNAGPDADMYRDAATGKVMDASESGTTIGTFTAHRSPLGLVFDIKSEFGGEYQGKGFVLNFQEGSATYGPMQDPGQDLLMLDLKKNPAGDDYTLNAHSIAIDFFQPTDAEIVDNKLYILEGQGQIWEITFPKAEVVTGTEPAQKPFSIYPNPIRGQMQIEGPLTQQNVQMTVTDMTGRALIREVRRVNGKTELDVSKLPAGAYLLQVESQKQQVTTRFIVNP
ncbi:Por secretion system C-terminal sorting domain-containing protein [Dyadobacter soli]|uniref:Por secretion system C-terminal sorting domain-containing protein n=1 Tax=Dyadobacter soli TaxID=659014 RepID=A0A1G7BTK9_9BACT|nr:T9SS type A sorting domain-containing protein [Dyadobacter soli]SDE29535.1 Por secretion system C-terminal sorting domain-containing protein [Dyadobacter soli]